MKKVSTELLRAVPVGGIARFSAKSGRDARRAQNLCAYYTQVEGAEKGEKLVTQHDKTNGVIIIKKIQAQ